MVFYVKIFKFGQVAQKLAEREVILKILQLR